MRSAVAEPAASTSQHTFNTSPQCKLQQPHTTAAGAGAETGASALGGVCEGAGGGQRALPGPSPPLFPSTALRPSTSYATTPPSTSAAASVVSSNHEPSDSDSVAPSSSLDCLEAGPSGASSSLPASQPATSSRLRFSFRLPNKPARRLKRIASFQPNCLRRLGILALRMGSDGLISLAERAAARDAEVAALRRQEPSFAVPPAIEQRMVLAGEPLNRQTPAVLPSGSALPGTHRSPAGVPLPGNGSSDVVLPQQRPPPPGGAPNNSPLLVNLLSNQQQQQAPASQPQTSQPHAQQPPSTPGAGAGYFPPTTPVQPPCTPTPVTPGGTGGSAHGHVHPQHMDPQQMAAMQHQMAMAERQRMIQMQQQHQQMVKHQQQQQAAVAAAHAQAQQRTQQEQQAQNQATQAQGQQSGSAGGSSESATPGPPSTPGGQYYNATTPGGPHSVTPQPRPPSFGGPGTPGGPPQQMFSPPHPHVQMQMQQQQMQQQQIQQQMHQHQMHHQQMQMALQQRQQIGVPTQYRPGPAQPMPIQPHQEEAAPPPAKKKRKPTKKQQKEAEMAQQQAAAAASHGAHPYYGDGRAVHPAAMEGRPMPAGMMMGGYPGGQFTGGQMPPGHHVPPHPHAGYPYPHAGTQQQQHMWQVQMQQRMMYQQQAGGSVWPPPQRAPPVPYPQGTNPDAENAMNPMLYQQHQQHVTTNPGMFRRDSGGLPPDTALRSTPTQGQHTSDHQGASGSGEGPSGSCNSRRNDSDFDTIFSQSQDGDLGDLDDIEPMADLGAGILGGPEELGMDIGRGSGENEGPRGAQPGTSGVGAQTERPNGQDIDSSIDSVVERSRPQGPPMSQAGPTMTHTQTHPHGVPLMQMAGGRPPGPVSAGTVGVPPFSTYHPSTAAHHINSPIHGASAMQQQSAGVRLHYENGQRPILNGHDQLVGPHSSQPSCSSLPNGTRRPTQQSTEEEEQTEAKIAAIVTKVMQVSQQKESRQGDSGKQAKGARKNRRKAEVSKETSPKKEEEEGWQMGDPARRGSVPAGNAVQTANANFQQQLQRQQMAAVQQQMQPKSSS